MNVILTVLGNMPMDDVFVCGEGEQIEAPVLIDCEVVGPSSSTDTEVVMESVRGNTLSDMDRGKALSVKATRDESIGFEQDPRKYNQNIALGAVMGESINVNASYIGKPYALVRVNLLSQKSRPYSVNIDELLGSRNKMGHALALIANPSSAGCETNRLPQIGSPPTSSSALTLAET